MYKNAGKRLLEVVTDTTAMAVFGWIMLGLAIWGYVALFTEISGIVGFFAGAIVATIGGVKSWYKNLERAAMAEMAMNVYSISQKMGLTAEEHSATKEKSATSEGWECAFCGQINAGDSNRCRACDVERTSSDEMMRRKIEAKRKWKCVKCGQENTVNVCQSCGVTREWSEKQSQENAHNRANQVCPRCGTAYTVDASFCTACGAKLRQ